jgi:hypothetical protein
MEVEALQAVDLVGIYVLLASIFQQMARWNGNREEV